MIKNKDYYRWEHTNQVIMYRYKKNYKSTQTRVYGDVIDLKQLVEAMYDVVGYPVPEYKASTIVKPRTRKSSKGRDAYIILEELLLDLYECFDYGYSRLRPKIWEVIK